MNNVNVQFITSQVLYQGPLLLAALIGLVLSLAFLGRSRWPAILTLSAMVILLVSTVAVTAVQAYFFSARIAYGWSNDMYGQVSSVLALLGSVSRGLVICLLLVAVFIGRKREKPIPT